MRRDLRLAHASESAPAFPGATECYGSREWTATRTRLQSPPPKLRPPRRRKGYGPRRQKPRRRHSGLGASATCGGQVLCFSCSKCPCSAFSQPKVRQLASSARRAKACSHGLQALSFPTCFCQKYLGILFLCKEMCQELRALLSPNGAKYESPGQGESRKKRLSQTPWVRDRPSR